MDWLSMISSFCYYALMIFFVTFGLYSGYRAINNKVPGDRVTGIVSIILMVVLIYIMTLIFRR